MNWKTRNAVPAVSGTPDTRAANEGMQPNDPKDLLEFPCHYQFKAVGSGSEAFRHAIVAAVERHVPVSSHAVRCRPSGKGKYQSVSVLVTLHNYQQLVDIYAEMRQVDELKILL